MKRSELTPAGELSSPKRAATNFMDAINDGAEAIHMAAEVILRELATGDDATWNSGLNVKLDPNEAVILRMAGIMVGDQRESTLAVERQVARVRIELRERQIYKGKAALAEAERIAKETAEAERREAGKLEDAIRAAQEQLAALGEATKATRATVEQMIRSKETLEQYAIPPFLAQRAAAITGSVQRSDLKKRLIELEGRFNTINEAQRRVDDWEEAERHNKENPSRQVVLPPKPPTLTTDQERERVTLPDQIREARDAMKEAARDAHKMIADFIEYGFKGEPGYQS